MGSGWKSDDEECSVIGDKGEIGFIDYEDDKSVCSYNPIEEGPVVISAPFLFVGGKPQSVLVGQTSTDSITINNTTSEPIDLWTVKIFCSNPEDSYTLSLMKPPSDNSTTEDVESFLETFTLEDRVLQPRKTLTVWLSCKPKDIGLHTTVVHFDAGDDRIERVVFLLAEDKISQSLASNKPYQRAQRKKRFAVTDYVAGSRPARPGNQSYKYKLPPYTIPGDIRESLETKQVPEVVSEGLNRENYGAFFSTLLIMEELKLEEDMKGHDMECITMRRRGQFLALEVPGLAERRPSLVIGDFVFAKPAIGDPDDGIPPYQGFIHRVEADEVFLKFNRDMHFLHTDGDLYNIRFTYNRVNMRRLYQAVQNAGKLDDELLFPSQSSRRAIQAAPAVPLTRCLNMEQMTSVEMILGCKGAPPYVIHGPPGTGKTLTLVEAILQLYKTRKNSRILVCASSNSAADHVLENLISKDYVKIQESEVFRLNASSRPYEDVRTERIQFCYFEEYVFRCPPIKALMRYRIIISTYMSASLLYAEGIKQGHFSHIFLDEAGQASEPETMVPISNLCRRETVVVLAGDPMQLGPVIYSKDAETYGLGKSYLERLFECEFYRNEDENFVTKLVRNYRCHPAILELPSKLFYKGELIADKEEAKSPLGSWANLLPNKDFPVLFIGIQGCDEREGNNPSWFNRIEASKVVEIIRKLRTSAELNDSDIGVITPYRQQVQKLRKTLDDQMDMPDVKVGSVEQFQGQERQVIIISTVRSTVKHNEFDRVHYLGFLSNPRRFNVAITRARSLLVIIGNPHIITKDPYWDKLLRYCADNNSYQGCPLPERQEFAEEDFNVSQKLYYEQDNFQSSNQGEWGSEQENFQPSNEAGWGDNHGEWGDGQQNYQPSNEAGWGDNQGEWGGGQQNFQSSNEAGWVDSQGDGQQNFQPSNEAGWGDSQGEWGDGQQNIKPSNESGWGDSQGEWGDGQQNIKPSNESGWGDNEGEWRNEAGWGDNQGKWGDEQQNFKPSNETGWDDKQGEWDDRQQNFKPSNEAGWDDKQGEWDDRQQNFKPSNEAGWDDRQQNFKPSNEAGWDDKQGEWDDRQQNFKPSNEAGWDDKQGEWDDRQQNFKPSNEAGWDDESSNAAEKAKPVNDDAGWSDGRKSTEIPNPVAKKAGWPDGRRSGQSPKPIAEKAGRSDGWRSRQSPKPVKYEAKSSNGWRVRQSPKPVKYEAKSSNGWRSAELPKPITDDSEGSDGWKSAEVPSSVTKEAESSGGRNSLQCPKPVTNKLNSSGGSKSSKFSKPVTK